MGLIDFVKEWFRFADNDLISAKCLFEDLRPKQIEIACYHCQQCAEKALKGFLVWKDVEPPKIHNLPELCRLCAEYDSSFETIISSCKDLTPYGISARYPNELETDELNAKSAIQKAQNIYNFCVAKIPPLVPPEHSQHADG
ncbi:MAG: HEPN domain-containing protein [Candidatus Margulisbacteria bacterium]|jgi:HEPN domain-containing protein|nr:HEPN domain-containing protein [Candidatus Margulisiibacteriota bacterium]